MNSISSLLHNARDTRDVVPFYFIPAAGKFIMTGGTGIGGAIVVDSATGQVEEAFKSKRAALLAYGVSTQN